MKYLNDDVGKWKGIETYLNAKKELSGQIYSMKWRNRYSSRKSVGSCVYLCDKWKPTSYEDFYLKYLESGEKDVGNDLKERGRTADEIEDIAVKWRNDCQEQVIPLETFFYGVIVHVIVETFQGQKHENDVVNQLEKSGFKVLHGDYNEDALMNIDLKVYEKGESSPKFLLQIKPIRFITSYRGDVILDKLNAFKKNALALQKYPNSKMFYLVYDNSTDNWIINIKKNRCAFEYDELVDMAGKPVISEAKLKNNETNVLFRK